MLWSLDLAVDARLAGEYGDSSGSRLDGEREA
jgi:hypothetical protein